MPTHGFRWAGSMTTAKSLRAAGLPLRGTAVGNLLGYIDIEAEYRSRFGGCCRVEMHLSHLGEFCAGDRVEPLTQVPGVDDMREPRGFVFMLTVQDLDFTWVNLLAFNETRQ